MFNALPKFDARHLGVKITGPFCSTASCRISAETNEILLAIYSRQKKIKRKIGYVRCSGTDLGHREGEPAAPG